jgi:hypothetical protein
MIYCTVSSVYQTQLDIITYIITPMNNFVLLSVLPTQDLTMQLHSEVTWYYINNRFDVSDMLLSATK